MRTSTIKSKQCIRVISQQHVYFTRSHVHLDKIRGTAWKKNVHLDKIRGTAWKKNVHLDKIRGTARKKNELSPLNGGTELLSRQVS